MRYVVRALGWATKILWIFLVAFSVTSVYSAMNVKIGFGEPKIFLSNGSAIISLPLLVNNTGFYDLSELNLTAKTTNSDGSLVSSSTTFVPLIPRGTCIETANNISLTQDDIEYHLFKDTLFNVNMSLRLKFSQAIPFQVSMNTTVPWGAPLYNFSVGQISYDFYNLTHQRVIVPLYFENHSPYFGLDGIMQLSIYNNRGELAGSEASDIDVPSQSIYDSQLELSVDISKITTNGELHFFFKTPITSFGPLVIPYG
jgi:hypothetical protein